MKKKFKLLLLLFAILIPTIVNAGRQGPHIHPYKMIVTNPDGIDYYLNDEVKGHLDKDDTFTVVDEGAYSYISDNYIIIVGEETTEYELKSLDGAALIEDEVDPEKEINSKDNNTVFSVTDDKFKKFIDDVDILVVAEEGVDIRKGPSETYDKVGHLDKGTKIKFHYYVMGVCETHVYVEYNDVKGWVALNDANHNVQVLIKKPVFEYIAKYDVKLSCTSIAKNTIISMQYFSSSDTDGALFEYNGCTELISLYDTNLVSVNQWVETGLATKKLDIYEYARDNGNKIATILENTEFTILGSDKEQNDITMTDYYVQYENKTGWIRATDDDYKTVENTTNTTDEDNSNKTDKNPSNYPITYIIIGTISALIAIFIIIIAIKNKKKHEEKGE